MKPVPPRRATSSSGISSWEEKVSVVTGDHGGSLASVLFTVFSLTEDSADDQLTASWIFEGLASAGPKSSVTSIAVRLAVGLDVSVIGP